MIKVSVLYPQTEESTFDFDYYCKHHMPMIKAKLGSTCKGVAVERGLSGAAPGSAAMYIAMGHIYFDTVEDFMVSFGPYAKSFREDVKNYTNIRSIIQVSEMLIPSAK